VDAAVNLGLADRAVNGIVQNAMGSEKLVLHQQSHRFSGCGKRKKVTHMDAQICEHTLSSIK
jgi:hypothetical protein